jgi:hypothetical protein
MRKFSDEQAVEKRTAAEMHPMPFMIISPPSRGSSASNLVRHFGNASDYSTWTVPGDDTHRSQCELTVERVVDIAVRAL